MAKFSFTCKKMNMVLRQCEITAQEILQHKETHSIGNSQSSILNLLHVITMDIPIWYPWKLWVECTCDIHTLFYLWIVPTLDKIIIESISYLTWTAWTIRCS